MTFLPRTADDQQAASAPSLLSQWRWWILPAVLSLTLSIVFRDPFAGDWDSLDYTVLAVNGWEPSSMLLGRMLFMFTNRVAFLFAHQFFGLPADKAYLLFKFMVIAQAPLATTALWALARELSSSVRTATVAALLLALSPYYVVYGGQAMTEIPSILVLCVALTMHLRGLKRRSIWRVIVGAALLGIGVNLREGVGLFGLWLVLAPFVCGWRFKPRELAVTLLACAVFFLAALGPFVLWFGLDVNGYRGKWWGWVESTKMESTLHPVSLENFRPLMRWFFIAAPLSLVLLPFALFKEWRERGLTPIFVMAAIGLFANLSLISHYSTVINGRYLLTGLPGLVPLVADFLVRTLDLRRLTSAFKTRVFERNEHRGFVPAVILVCVVGLWIGWRIYPEAWPTIEYHATWKDYRTRLEAVPKENSVVIVGAKTVAVSFWRGVGAGNWEIIGTGGGWPGDDRLVPVIQQHLDQGRRVFLDADPQQWSASGWQVSETRTIASLERHFRFRRVGDNLFELRAQTDTLATDDPNLENLLPENRAH